MRSVLVLTLIVSTSLVFAEETLIDAVNKQDGTFIKSYQGDLDAPVFAENRTALMYAIEKVCRMPFLPCLIRR